MLSDLRSFDSFVSDKKAVALLLPFGSATPERERLVVVVGIVGIVVVVGMVDTEVVAASCCIETVVVVVKEQVDRKAPVDTLEREKDCLCNFLPNSDSPHPSLPSTRSLH